MMIRTVLALLLLLAGPAWADGVIPAPGVAIGGAVDTNTALGRTLAAQHSDRINIKDAPYNAKGDLIGYADGTATVGSNVIYDPSATFTPADVGKQASLTGSASNGATQTGTITGYTDSHHVATSFTPALATPAYGVISASVAVAQSGSGNYIPGDTLTIVGGSPVIPSAFKVIDTQVTAATINAAGTGGTAGSCVLTGTTGSTRYNNPTTTRFQINATIAAGGISALGSIVTGSQYSTNPTSLTAEPVTGCGLTGATLSLTMGVFQANATTYGNYLVPLSGTYATTTTGSGTGATLAIGGTTEVGGQFNYGTDDSAALSAAITTANSDFIAGVRRRIYAPGSSYLIKGNQLPTFVGNAGIEGDGPRKTRFYIDPTYAGDVFSWSQAWLGVNGSFPFGGGTVSPSVQAAGASVRDIGIVGDRSATAHQNALMFYDQNDFVRISDVDVEYMRGRGLCLACATKNTSFAYLRESQFSQLRFDNDGDAGVPVIELAAFGKGGSDDDTFSDINIYAPFGTGILIHAGTGASVGSGNSVWSRTRIEGLEWNPPGIAADLLEIGDTASGFCGPVVTIAFTDLQLIDPYLGYAGFRMTANPACVSVPYGITADHMRLFGGFPYGDGIHVDAGRSSFFGVDVVNVIGTDLTVGASPLTAPGLFFDGRGLETQWTTNIDPSAYGFVSIPAYDGGLVTVKSNLNARNSGALQSLTTGTFDTGFGSGACAAVTTQGGNTCLGAKAGNTTTGTGNSFFGNVAGQYAAGNTESFFGSGAGVGVSSSPLTGANNTGFGANAGAMLQGAAANNTLHGANAGAKITTGVGNTIIGQGVASGTLVTGSTNVIIGTDSTVDAPASSTTNYMNLFNNLVMQHVSGHLAIAGTVLTSANLSGCTIGGGSTDFSGSATATTSPCTVTFGSSWGTIPGCIVTSRSGLALSYTVAATTLTVSNASLSGSVFDWKCTGTGGKSVP